MVPQFTLWQVSLPFTSGFELSVCQRFLHVYWLSDRSRYIAKAKSLVPFPHTAKGSNPGLYTDTNPGLVEPTYGARCIHGEGSA